MKKSVEEQSLRTLALAAAGFAALVLAVPEWARVGVAVFGALVAVLAYAVDPAVRAALRFGVRSTRAKSPGERRVAT